ncbi:MAG: hemin uptake protein HemP [Roseateles sp.]
MLVEPEPPQPAAPPALTRADLPAPRRIDSAALLGARGELLIVHGPQVYRLRVTRQGKLILTK